MTQQVVPELAVVVLSVGAQRGVVAAVASVLAQEAPLEVVVVNSGGGDAAGLLARFGAEVSVIDRQAQLFPGAARNLGVASTRARFVAFLAADCVAAPGWAANRLRRHLSGAEAVSSAVKGVDDDNRFVVATQVLLYARRSPRTPRPLWSHYGLSYSRDLFARFGNFRADLRTGEDTEFHARFGGCVHMVAARDVVVSHRHPETLREFVTDQFRRGYRSASTWRQLRRSSALADGGPRGLERARSSIEVASLRASTGELAAIARARHPVVAGSLVNEAGRVVGTAAGVLGISAADRSPLRYRRGSRGR